MLTNDKERREYINNGANKSFTEVGKTEIIGLLKDADLRGKNNG